MKPIRNQAWSKPSHRGIAPERLETRDKPIHVIDIGPEITSISILLLASDEPGTFQFLNVFFECRFRNTDSLKKMALRRVKRTVGIHPVTQHLNQNSIGLIYKGNHNYIIKTITYKNFFCYRQLLTQVNTASVDKLPLLPRIF